jgi:hypothetical protein
MPSPDRNFANSAIFTQTTTGTTPNAGDNSLYFKSDSNIYSKNSSGTEIQISGGTAGGDLSGSYPNPTVDGLQGRPVSNATPVNGQVLQYDGANWVPGSIPSGGSGGGGVVYYLNFNTAADAPLTNIPQTPNASKELGIVADATTTSYQSPVLSVGSYDFLASFVTDVSTPSATTIPAGIWDFNIFAQSTAASASNEVYFKIEILKYDGVNAPTLIATSNDSYIYDPNEITQYVASVIVPQTTILATDRIVVYFYGRAQNTNKRLTFHFGGQYPSHTHSTMPSVTGTGVAKVVNGVFQSPASTIVNADVSATAAIAISKLSQATARILGRTTAGEGAVEEISIGTGLTLSSGTLNATSAIPETDVQIFSTAGTFTWTKPNPTLAKSVNIQLFAGGGGGGGGRKDTTLLTAKSGGGGGGGGGYLNITIPAAALGVSESVVIGAGGTSGSGSTTGSGVAGGNGGNTTFNSLICLGGLGGGVGSTNAASGGNGILNSNNGASSSITGNGGIGSPTGVALPTQFGGAGGGGGGCISAAGSVFAGGVGGRSNVLNFNGGASGANTGVSGTAGTNNTSASTGLFAVGSGGGGGGAGLAVSGGAGGAGGFPAGGGGGGGATETGTSSGAGGIGGDGLAIITTYF